MRRIDLLFYGFDKKVGATNLLYLLHRFETTKDLEKALLEEFKAEDIANFKLQAEKDADSPLREYFKQVCPEEVKDWERLDGERKKKHEYISKNINFYLQSDGTVVKAHGREI